MKRIPILRPRVRPIVKAVLYALAEMRYGTIARKMGLWDEGRLVLR